MDSRSPLYTNDYWYLGSPDPAIDLLFRRACSLAWPYAVHCATLYHRDPQLAYDLMDEAVANAESYYQRSSYRTAIQLTWRIFSVIKRRSKQRMKRNKEIASGTLSDLELLAPSIASGSSIEQGAFVRQILDRLPDRTHEVVRCRQAGQSWRQIAKDLGVNYITLRRGVQKEIRGLLQVKSNSHGSDAGDESE